MSMQSEQHSNNSFLDFEIFNQPINQAIHNSNLKNIKSFCSGDVFVVASRNQDLTNILHNSTIYCDSKPLAIYLAFKNGSQRQIRGSDFMRQILLSPGFIPEEHLFIGGFGNVKEGITSFLMRHSLEKKKIELHFIFPPKNVEWQVEYENWLEVIKSGKFKHVWIGLGNPKQFFIAKLLNEKFSKANYYCVGAAFDFLSGVKRETPRVFQLLALEWLFRLIQEPRRLWRRYLIGNLLFLKIIAVDLFWK